MTPRLESKARPQEHAVYGEHHDIRTMQPPFSIAALVYACRTREGIVFLDLRRDRYCGVSARELQGLLPLVSDLSSHMQVAQGATAATTEEGLRTAETLIAAGILTRGLETRSTIRSRTISTHGELVAIGDEIDYQTKIRAHHVLNFVIASTLAKLQLTCLPFHRVVAQVHDARMARTQGREAFDPVRTGELVSIFRRLRPFMFAAKGRCLYHALALITFLRRYDRFASWVIGVKTNPWGAHSWVQEDDFVLDTNPEKVCEFTPILAI